MMSRTAMTAIVILLIMAAPASAATEAVLYSFAGGAQGDGSGPASRLIIDAKGNLYGTTVTGGSAGGGTVFKLAKDGTETVLHSFLGSAEGINPRAGVTMDADGNIYGTTAQGGPDNDGTVYKLTKKGKLVVLHSFANGTDGVYPLSDLLMDAGGTLFGTASNGGQGAGTFFKVSGQGKFKTIYAFVGGADGSNPPGGIITDGGDYFGTTNSGGDHLWGTVYRATGGGAHHVIYSFTGEDDGRNPSAALVFGKDGNLYGTTYFGGTSDMGTVFKLTPDGTQTVLHSFAGGAHDGANPAGQLVVDSKGNFYGTAVNAASGTGTGPGVIFKVTKAGKYSVAYKFKEGGSDGANSLAGLTIGPDGALYGTTSAGGDHAVGTVFKLTMN